MYSMRKTAALLKLRWSGFRGVSEFCNRETHHFRKYINQNLYNPAKKDQVELLLIYDKRATLASLLWLDLQRLNPKPWPNSKFDIAVLLQAEMSTSTRSLSLLEPFKVPYFSIYECHINGTHLQLLRIVKTWTSPQTPIKVDLLKDTWINKHSILV